MRGAAQAAADGAALGRGQRAAQVAVNGVPARGRAGVRRSRSGGVSARRAIRGAGAIGDREVLERSRAARGARARTPPCGRGCARPAGRAPAAPRASRRRGCARAGSARPGPASLTPSGSLAASSARRASAPPGLRQTSAEPQRRKHRRAAAAAVAAQRREPQVDDGARVTSCRSNGRQGPLAHEIGRDRGREAALERRPRLDGAAFDDVGDRRLAERRQRHRRRRAQLARRPAERAGDRVEARERRVVDRQHDPRARRLLDDPQRQLGDRGGVGARRRPAAGASTSSRLSRISTRPPFALARHAAQVVGRVLAGDRRRRCRPRWSRAPARARDRGSWSGSRRSARGARARGSARRAAATSCRRPTDPTGRPGAPSPASSWSRRATSSARPKKASAFRS